MVHHCIAVEPDSVRSRSISSRRKSPPPPVWETRLWRLPCNNMSHYRPRRVRGLGRVFSEKRPILVRFSSTPSWLEILWFTKTWAERWSLLLTLSRCSREDFMRTYRMNKTNEWTRFSNSIWLLVGTHIFCRTKSRLDPYGTRAWKRTLKAAASPAAKPPRIGGKSVCRGGTGGGFRR